MLTDASSQLTNFSWAVGEDDKERAVVTAWKEMLSGTQELVSKLQALIGNYKFYLETTTYRGR